MIRAASVAIEQPAMVRLSALAELDAAARHALAEALASARPVPMRREIQVEGEATGPAQILAAGWAARVRIFGDGRRRFLSMLLPGDIIGLCDQPGPIAVSTVVALTPLKLCLAPLIAAVPSLARAYAMSRALHEAYLIEQIVRLSGLTALERIASLLLELHERLSLNGMAHGNAFDIPLTQEMLGDALGLTSVHINRMLQQARRSGDLQWASSRVTIKNPAALARSVGRLPVRISECSV